MESKFEWKGLMDALLIYYMDRLVDHVARALGLRYEDVKVLADAFLTSPDPEVRKLHEHIFSEAYARSSETVKSTRCLVAGVVVYCFFIVSELYPFIYERAACLLKGLSSVGLEDLMEASRSFDDEISSGKAWVDVAGILKRHGVKVRWE